MTPGPGGAIVFAMPKTTVVERVRRIRATPETLLPLLRSLPEWVAWSPWEGMDPELKRTYTGEPGTVGSGYSWEGNRKAGAGRMTITGIAGDGVGVDLVFTRPFKSASAVRFLLAPEGEETVVTWRMESPQTLFSRLFDLDKLVGRDFEKGLRQLAEVAEGGGRAEGAR